MSPRFLAFMPFIFEWEGGYDNDPHDPGGETKYGIDKRSHPHEDIRALTKDRAREIYWSEWQRDGCEQYPRPLGEVYFNACVNCGRGRANSLMRAGEHVAAQFLDAQDDFYRALASSRPASRRYLRGWLNRTESLREWCKTHRGLL